MWHRSQLTDMRTVGNKMHSHNSNCIYSVAKSNGDSIEFSLSIAEQRAVGFILAWSLASLHYSTSILHSYLTSSNLRTSFLLLQIQSRNMCKCIQRYSIFLLLYGASASWLSPVVMGSLAIDRLLICHLGIILVQVCSRLKLYRIPEVSFNCWVLEYQHW